MVNTIMFFQEFSIQNNRSSLCPSCR